MAKSPYEQYLVQTIEDEKKHLDSLYNEFAHSNPIRKSLVKRKIDEAIQNIELLSGDLSKYQLGLSWLREPSKERDEKAEHLPELAKEEPEKPVAPPVGAARPATPQAARPTIGRPVIGKPATTAGQQAATPPSPSVTPVAKPTTGTPVGRPKIGTPIGTSESTEATTPTQQQAQPTNQPAAVTAPPASTVKRPRIGTPIGQPVEKKDENQSSSS